MTTIRKDRLLQKERTTGESKAYLGAPGPDTRSLAHRASQDASIPPLRLCFLKRAENMYPEKNNCSVSDKKCEARQDTEKEDAQNRVRIVRNIIAD